jgi:hypothetical protein
MRMKKIIVRSLSVAILFPLLMSMAYADHVDQIWRVASSCKVATIKDSFYFEGNIANHNIQNTEEVEVLLIKCSAADSSDGHRNWFVRFRSDYPELGDVKVSHTPIPREVLSRWVQTLQYAKANDLKVNAFGIFFQLGNFIDSMITLELD